jgi:hypothetical protein
MFTYAGMYVYRLVSLLFRTLICALTGVRLCPAGFSHPCFWTLDYVSWLVCLLLFYPILSLSGC